MSKNMKKNRSMVKNYLIEWYDWLVDHLPESIKTVARKKFVGLKNNTLRLYDGVEKILKGDVENQKQAENKTNLTVHKMVSNDNYTRLKMPFNSLIAELFEGSDINDLIQRMLAHIKKQVENPQMPKSGFTLHKTMHLYINFHRLALTRSSSYIDLPGWIQNKQAVLNPQNKDEECFKWAVIAALHGEEIKKVDQCMSKLEPYENQ